MEHVLDNPAWSALHTGNAQLANGNAQASFFDSQVSPFAALANNTAHELAVLHRLLPDNSPRLLITRSPMDFGTQWEVQGCIKGFQMVYLPATGFAPVQGVTALTHTHVPQMLALTQLTNPGPFVPRTIEFGHYKGIFNNDELAAMAGQRLHAGNYTEVSAVCTHPRHLGKGYARQLLQYHISRMLAAGNTPFLHVRHDNERAIKVYQSLGFETRVPIYFYVIIKA